MVTKIILIVVAALVIAFLALRMSAARVTGPDARTLVAGGALLVDVRTKREFDGGHIGGAVNIPVQELIGRMDELGERDRDVVVYCQSGGRSAIAKRVLESSGFRRVHDLGAIGNW